MSNKNRSSFEGPLLGIGDQNSEDALSRNSRPTATEDFGQRSAFSPFADRLKRVAGNLAHAARVFHTGKSPLVTPRKGEKYHG